VALGEALKVNTSLTKLRLSGSSIGDEGAASLLEALTKCNTTLTELDLDESDISETISSAIAAFVDTN
jgi:Leucine Rich repeat